MRWRRRVGALAVTAAVAVAMTGCAKDLGIGLESSATAVSDGGWIGGEMTDEAGTRAFIRHPDKTLSTFGDANDRVLAINDAGTAVGTTSNEAEATVAGWRWTAATGRQALDGAGARVVAPADINDDGLVVGSILFTPLLRSGPVYWNGATPVFLPLPAGADFRSGAKSVNTEGDIAGVASLTGGTQQVVWWDRSEGYALRTLATGGATAVNGIGIADDGTIAATLRFADGTTAGVWWAPGATTYSVLTAPGPVQTLDIGKRGDIVGYVELDGHRRAARWTWVAHTFIDLGVLEGGPDSQVNAVDLDGRMVGSATNSQGRRRAATFEG